ncbi:MAG: hypothetical protein JO041_04075 [Acidobacteria bacterium]|nr:hypothetical protein [Acidobacteriota bacterium]
MRKWFLAALVALLAMAAVVAQQRSKRLVLKDGSYQSVTKWEMQGDRVHYMSAERYEWEDLPASLVNWEATNKYNASLDQPDLNVKTVTEEDAKERAAEEAASPQVAPGLRLPEGGGVFLLDQFSGQAQLDELQQSGGELNAQKTKNILRAAVNPVSSAKQSIELKGAHAKVQCHVKLPTLYVNAGEGEQDAAAPAHKEADAVERYRIVRAEAKKDVRVIGNVKISVVGRTKEQENMVPARAEDIGGGWTRITPVSPLEPGEYAVAEMLGESQMNLFVWDFGVNPAAPANPSAWKPEPAPEKTQRPAPVLQKPPE